MYGHSGDLFKCLCFMWEKPWGFNNQQRRPEPPGEVGVLGNTGRRIVRWLLRSGPVSSGWRQRLSVSAVRRAEIVESLDESTALDSDYILLVILSCIIASFCLMVNSTAVTIGAPRLPDS